MRYIRKNWVTLIAIFALLAIAFFSAALAYFYLSGASATIVCYGEVASDPFWEKVSLDGSESFLVFPIYTEFGTAAVRKVSVHQAGTKEAVKYKVIFYGQRFPRVGEELCILEKQGPHFRVVTVVGPRSFLEEYDFSE